MKQTQNLYEVLSSNSKHISSRYLDQLYNEYFHMNWLRPETALYYFYLSKAMYKFMYHFKQPILDLGCGDGTFMTTFFGGIFDKKTDSYRNVNLNKKDIYDNFAPLKDDIVFHKPTERLYGLDIRENLVKTARDLKTYKLVKTGDVREIPYKNKFFNTVYCNMINDIKNEYLSKVFSEIYRVLKDNGFLIFTTPTEDFLDCLYYKKTVWTVRPISFWKKFLKEEGFEPVAYEPFMDEKLLKFWDTGFRPYFKDLLKIVRKNKCIPELKTVYVEILKNYFFDYVNRPLEGKIGFILVVAKKVNK